MKDHQIIRTGNISPIYVGAAFVGVDFAAGSSRARAAVDCVSTKSSAPTETGLATRREIYTYCHSRRLSQRETPCAAGILMDTSPGEIGRVLVGPAVVIAVPVVAGSIRMFFG